MMLHPSYSDLMEVANKDVEEGDSKLVNSRYSIVEPYVVANEKSKPLSVAVDELYHEKVKIVGGEEAEAEKER